ITGNEAVGSTPDEFERRFKADLAKIAKIVKEAHIPAQDLALTEAAPGYSRSRLCRPSREIARGPEKLRHPVLRDAGRRAERQEPGAADGRSQAARARQ